jgi:hypothetical protein
MNKKFTLVHYSLLSLSLIYSFVFYNMIAIELAIMAIIFDLVKPSIFITALQSRGIKRNIFSLLVIILVGFNLLAISSNFINKYNKQTVSKSINNEYTKQQDKLRQLKSNIETIETESKNYPSLDKFLEKSPKWEDKTALNQSWQQGKQEITNRLNSTNKEYNKELLRKVDKYTVTNKQNGYSDLFTATSKLLKVDSKVLILILYLLFAVMLEILIFYTKTLSVKEFANYVKSADEMTADLVREINLELHNRQLQTLKNSFDLNLNSVVPDEKIIVKVIEKESRPEEPEQKLIEEAKADPELFVEKPLPIENIKSYHDFILENSNENIAIGYKKVADNLGLSQSEALRIYKKLKEKGYLVTVGLRTTIEKENFNKEDFEEV